MQRTLCSPASGSAGFAAVVFLVLRLVACHVVAELWFTAASAPVSLAAVSAEAVAIVFVLVAAAVAAVPVPLVLAAVAGAVPTVAMPVAVVDVVVRVAHRLSK